MILRPSSCKGEKTMAERRMFSKTLMHSSGFVCLSRAAFQLYVYLCLSADDDGFTDGLQTLFRICRCSKKQLQELVEGGWVIPFDSGVVAIAHWFLHNKIPKDRYKVTVYEQERGMLEKSGTGVYTRLDTKCIQDVSKLDTQDRIGKDSIGQDRIDQDRIEKDISIQSSGPQAACDQPEIDFEKILRDYQFLCKDMVPCTAMTQPLQEKIREAFRRGYNSYTLVSLFSKAGMSNFLRGENPQGWQASLEWLLEPQHMRHVLDGKYDNWHNGRIES